jgi:hypothetical protein
MRKILKTKKFIVGGMIGGRPPKSAAMKELKAAKPKKLFNKSTKNKLNKQGSHIKRIRKTAHLNVAITKKTNEIGASQKKITNLTSEKVIATTKHAELEGQQKVLDEEKLKIDADIAEGKIAPAEGEALKTELTKQQDTIKNKLIISAQDISQKQKVINTASSEHTKKKTEHSNLTIKSDAKKKKLGIDEASQAAFIQKTLDSVPINKITGLPDVKKQAEAEATIEKEKARIATVTEGIAAKASNITTKPERIAALESYKKAKKELKEVEAAEALNPKDGQSTGVSADPGKILDLQGPGQERLRQGEGSGDIKLILSEISKGQAKQTQVLAEAIKQGQQGQQGQQGPPKKLTIGQKLKQAFRRLTGTTNANQKRKEKNKVKRQEDINKAKNKAYRKKYGNNTEA